MMIRRMVVADITAVLKIENQLFHDNWDQDTFNYELTGNPFSYYVVLVLEGNIIGYAGCWLTYENAQITNIGILPTYQRQGYGQQLMDHLLNQVRQAGGDYLTLEVRVSNYPAINFYEKNGFVKVSVKKGYYKNNYEDAYYMVRKMNDEVQDDNSGNREQL